jgi:hypothetical protein
MRPHTRNIQAAVWLIGIGILALTHHWWPGILILVGISMVLGALTRGTPQRDEPMQPDEPLQPPVPQPYTPPPTPAQPSSGVVPPAAQAPVYDLGWVPNRCSSCGGPLNVNGLKVLDSHTVVCPFCGTKISKGL